MSFAHTRLGARSFLEALMNNAPIKLFCAVFKILILFTLQAIIVIKLVYHTSIKFHMFSFAWQLTVVNRTETKQRSIWPKQGSEGEVIVLSPLLTMVSMVSLWK